MKFSIAPQSLIRVLEILKESRPRRGEAVGRLVASQDKVSVQWGDTVAGAEAVVWGEGQVTVSLARLLRLLQSHSFQGRVTVQADGSGLRFNDCALPVLDYSPHAVAPGACRFYLASDWGVVSSKPTLSLKLAPA